MAKQQNTQTVKTGLSAIALALACFSLAGCTSFEGPQDLRAGGEFRAATGAQAPAAQGDDEEFGDALPPEASVTLNGERRFGRLQGKLIFDWPVDDARMTRGFFYGRRAHWGLDLANHKGTPIIAAEKGVVVYTGKAFRGYGKLVVIEHNGEWATLYAHLDKITVKEGETVERGQKIALMGRTGRASGVHLHFEMRQHKMPVNPLAYLPEIPMIAEQRHSKATRLIANAPGPPRARARIRRSVQRRRLQKPR